MKGLTKMTDEPRCYWVSEDALYDTSFDCTKSESGACLSVVSANSYDEMKRQRDGLLKALKYCHRKHIHHDETVGWENLEEVIHNALANVMGDDAYCKWVEEQENEPNKTR